MTPPRRVLERFGLRGEATPLAGGEGVTFRVGEGVVKRVHDVDEAEWTQALLASIAQDGFRVAEPIVATDGSWTVDGWSGSCWLPDLRPLAPAWDAVIDAGLRFGAAAESARAGGGAEILDRRTHRWAVAEQVAWGQAEVALSHDARAVVDRVGPLLAAPSDERHVVHGDLTGNVFADPTGVPVILDVSPYLRPRRWAAAIVIADAVLWNGVDPTMARGFASDEHDRDLLGRALVFRLVAEQLASAPRHHADVAPFRHVLDALL